MTFNCQKIDEVKQNLRNIFPATPLQKSKYLSEKYEAHIYLKREDLSPVRSYKIRGAYNFISSFLADPEKSKDITFVTASAGNHAQGFAFACQKFGIEGKIFMPQTTPEQKVSRTKTFGENFVEIVLTGDTFDDAAAAAKAFCAEQNGIMVPPFDHPKIIEGQATVGSEILDELQNIDYLFMPVGGGGLSAGVSQYFQHQSPQTEIILTEPQGAPSLKTSLEKEKNTTLEKIDGFVDGAAVKRIGEHNFEVLKELVKNSVHLIPENRLCQTILAFLHHEGIILEPAGALAIDALRDMDPAAIKGKTIVCVASGGNFDFERLPDIKERAQRYAETKKYFILRMPQRPGALKEFLNFLGPDDDIARFEYFKKSTKNFGSVLIGVETPDPENFKSLFAKMEAHGFDYDDITDNEILADFVI